METAPRLATATTRKSTGKSSASEQITKPGGVFHPSRSQSRSESFVVIDPRIANRHRLGRTSHAHIPFTARLGYRASCELVKVGESHAD
jgi:hypothetical protein